MIQRYTGLRPPNDWRDPVSARIGRHIECGVVDGLPTSGNLPFNRKI